MKRTKEEIGKEVLESLKGIIEKEGEIYNEYRYDEVSRGIQDYDGTEYKPFIPGDTLYGTEYDPLRNDERKEISKVFYIKVIQKRIDLIYITEKLIRILENKKIEATNEKEISDYEYSIKKFKDSIFELNEKSYKLVELDNKFHIIQDFYNRYITKKDIENEEKKESEYELPPSPLRLSPGHTQKQTQSQSNIEKLSETEKKNIMKYMKYLKIL